MSFELLVIPVALLILAVILSILLRRVVPTNMVHIVQSRKKTTSYGTGHKSNVYWAWPSFVPLLGVAVIKLPVSNFDLSLKNYDAYDTDRVPFIVDVTAFFAIKDTNLAAKRVESVDELNNQLRLIVQGAVRKVLASADINTIMLERSTFGDQFTEEVRDQLKEWGVESVKTMELMDIRDANDSNVISNIMAMKKSAIEKESRVEVAKNRRDSEQAEIDAKRDVDVSTQDALLLVGQRTADKDKAVGIANESARQEILIAQKLTAENDMAVKKVEIVRQAEITKEEQIVAASQDKETKTLIAEGDLIKVQRDADGVRAMGEATAEAEKLFQLAPVQAKIALAKEIGANEGFQNYLQNIEAIDAYEIVGSHQAQALQNADVKVIANSGSSTGGMTQVMDLFSSNGGTQIASAVEAFAQSEFGADILSKTLKTKPPTARTRAKASSSKAATSKTATKAKAKPKASPAAKTAPTINYKPQG
ncbi:MAG: SPFH domain-containing protein [Hellea sp.]